jgi:methylmalonyl-CoA mutase
MYSSRVESLGRQRKSGTPEAHLLVLARLEKITVCPPDEFFDRVVDAVTAGATLGEYNGVMRDSAVPSLEVMPIPVRRDAAPFELLRARAGALRARRPSDARVYAACLGDFADYMPRLEFVRGFFAVAGCAVVGDRFHDTPAAAVAAARQDGAATVVLVGLDRTYGEMAEATARELAAGPEPRAVYLAGPPGETEAELRAAGVHEFIQLKSNVVDVLNSLLAKLEGQS